LLFLDNGTQSQVSAPELIQTEANLIDRSIRDLQEIEEVEGEEDDVSNKLSYSNNPLDCLPEVNSDFKKRQTYKASSTRFM